MSCCGGGRSVVKFLGNPDLGTKRPVRELERVLPKRPQPKPVEPAKGSLLDRILKRR